MNKDRRFKLTLFVILMLLILPGFGKISAFGFGDSSRIRVNIFSPENIKKFADYLYCQKDYLRAIEEYQKYLPGNPDDTVRFKIALGYRIIGSYGKAENLFISLSESSLLSDESKLELFKTRFFSNDFSGFQNLFNGYKDFPKKYYSEIKSLYFLSFLLSNKMMPEEQSFLDAFPSENRNEMREFYLRKKYPQYKSPVTASVLSTLVPGAGKIYTADYGDGITAFIVNGLLAYLAYDNFKSDHKFRGWAFAGLGVIFYGGNIYGSAAAAQIYNAEVDYNFSENLKDYLNKNNYFTADHEKFCK